MSGGLPLPPPEPPAEDAQQLLDDLRLARQELDDACNVLRLLEVGRPAATLTVHGRRRQHIETEVAELRAGRWAAKAHELEDLARAKGLQP